MTKATKQIKTSHPYLDSNIVESIERTKLRREAPAIINSKGEMLVLVEGEWLPEWEFNRVYYEIPITKKNWSNYDRTKNWLQNKKSY